MGYFSDRPAIRFRSARSRCGPPINTPGSMPSTPSTSPSSSPITGGGRFNFARIALEDQIGSALNGSDTYSRFNPIIGAHLQDQQRTDRLCRLFRSQSRADPAGTRLRRSGASLHHRRIPGLRSSVEAGRIPHRGSRFPRHAGSANRNDWMEAGSVSDRQYRRYPRNPKSGPAGVRLFPECRFDAPPGHRGGSHAEVVRNKPVRQLCADRRAIPQLPAAWFEQSLRRRRWQCPGAARQPHPRVPRNLFKAGIDYSVTDAFKVGGDMLVAGSQYYVGDEFQPGAEAARLRGLQSARLVPDQQELPGLRAGGQHFRQPLCDLWNVLRHHRRPKLRQWRGRVHGSRVPSARRGRAPSMPA